MLEPSALNNPLLKLDPLFKFEPRWLCTLLDSNPLLDLKPSIR
jgi:hypothetical protein